MKKIDLTGHKYGRWTVISQAENKSGRVYWRCKCDCGNEADVHRSSLRQGKSLSCGCLNTERTSQMGKFNTTHGQTKTRLFRIWQGMIHRCKNPDIVNYGGRGIKVCDGWLDFDVFSNWAFQNGYSDELSIERTDNDGMYCPENCIWATRKVQQNNRRNSRNITFNGETHSLEEWAEKLNINKGTLYARIARYNWSVEKALTTN